MSASGENLLKQQFISLIQDKFIIYSDVKGIHELSNKEFKIDFLIYPRQEMIDYGFDPDWFGVEVKHFDKKGDSGKLARFIWQALTYYDARYYVAEKVVIPMFVLCFSNYETINKNNDPSYPNYLTPMMLMANLGHVGSFETFGIINKGWRIRFASSTYFHFRDGIYKRHNLNIRKLNAGNCQ